MTISNQNQIICGVAIVTIVAADFIPNTLLKIAVMLVAVGFFVWTIGRGE